MTSLRKYRYLCNIMRFRNILAHSAIAVQFGLMRILQLAQSPESVREAQRPEVSYCIIGTLQAGLRRDFVTHRCRTSFRTAA